MTRIECETAAQCEQIAETMQGIMPKAIMATLVILVVAITLHTSYREVNRRYAA